MTRSQAMLLGLLAAIWGGSYALIKVSLDAGFGWAWIAFLRIFLGGAVLAFVAVYRTNFKALFDRLGWTFFIGTLQVGIPFMMIPWGELHVPTGLASVLVGAAPLFTALFAFKLAPGSAPDRRGLIGIMIGFVGVVLLFVTDLSETGDLLTGGAAILGAAVCYGIGTNLSKTHLEGMDPAVYSAATLLSGCLVTIPFAATQPFATHASPSEWLAMSVLGVICTGLAFMIFFMLVAQVGSTRTSLVTYFVPIFSLFYGIVLLNEGLTIWILLGIALIVGGSVAAARGRERA